MSFFWVGVVILCAGSSAWAESPKPQETASNPSVPKEAPSPLPNIETLPKKTSKGKRVREKEAEGTEAPDRFEADTVIKSKYRLNGEPLEVDPD